MISNFLKQYSKEPNIVEQLMMIYDFIDESFVQSKELCFDVTKELIKHFTNPKSTIDEIHTMLIITQGFKDNPLIKDSREELFVLYQILTKETTNKY